MSMNEQSVREYLLQHPDFMQRHPDVLPVGFEVVIPEASKYGIDVHDPRSVAKAKRLGDEAMKAFW